MPLNNKIAEIDRERATRIANLFGGKLKEDPYSADRVAAILAEAREDPEGLTSPLSWETTSYDPRSPNARLTMAEC